MEHLFKKNKENTIYHLCKCLGEMRDKSSARLCVDRMPFGLIAYNCKFFASNDASNLQAPEDYKKWMESMYCYFGNAWASLFLGPMWSYQEAEVRDHDMESNDIITEAIVSAFGELTIPDVSSTDVVATPDGPSLGSVCTGVYVTPGIDSRSAVSSASSVVCASSLENNGEATVVNSAAPMAGDGVAGGVPFTSQHNDGLGGGRVSGASLGSDVVVGVASVASLGNDNGATGISSNTLGSEGVTTVTSGRSVHDSQQHVSTLWSGISPSDRDDIEESEVDHRDIAALHNVVPQRSRPQRSLKRSTLDVS